MPLYKASNQYLYKNEKIHTCFLHITNKHRPLPGITNTAQTGSRLPHHANWVTRSGSDGAVTELQLQPRRRAWEEGNDRGGREGSAEKEGKGGRAYLRRRVSRRAPPFSSPSLLPFCFAVTGGIDCVDKYLLRDEGNSAEIG